MPVHLCVSESEYRSMYACVSAGTCDRESESAGACVSESRCVGARVHVSVCELRYVGVCVCVCVCARE